MTLIACKTCSHDCAENAKVCPNCGQSYPTKSRLERYYQLRRYFFIVLVIICVIAWFLSFHFYKILFATIALYAIAIIGDLIIITPYLIINWRVTLAYGLGCGGFVVSFFSFVLNRMEYFPYGIIAFIVGLFIAYIQDKKDGRY